MEPGNYLRIFLGRWKIIALAGLLGVIVGLVTVPAKSQAASRSNQPAELFTATNILIADGSFPGGTATTLNRVAEAQNLQLTALLAVVGEVPKRAAEALGFPDAETLATVISADPDSDVGTLRITATDTAPLRAAQIANTVAETLQDYLQELKRTRYQADLRETDALSRDLQRQVDAVQATISSRLPVSDPVLNAQRDALARRLQTARERIAALLTEGEATSGFSTLQEGRPVAVGSLPPASPLGTAGRSTSTTVRPTNTPGGSAGTGVKAPSGLARTLRVPLAGSMGLFLGGVLALLRERFDARVRTRGAAETAFGLPVIAEIPRSRWRRHRAAQLAIDAEPRGREAESYRLLRSRLLQATAASLWVADSATPAAGAQSGTERAALTGASHPPAAAPPDETPSRWNLSSAGSGPHQPVRVILVTSPDPGDGKTAVTVNLAAAISEVGTTALVLDLDFRASDMQRFFATTPAISLADVVERPATTEFDDAVHSADDLRMNVALSGRQLATPSSFLVAEHQIMTAARSRADTVLVDTPPLLAISDASELLPSADAVLVVSRVNKTSVDAAIRTSETLARLKAPVIGVILIGTSAKDKYEGYEPQRRARRKTLSLRGLVPLAVATTASDPAHGDGELSPARNAQPLEQLLNPEGDEEPVAELATGEVTEATDAVSIPEVPPKVAAPKQRRTPQSPTPRKRAAKATEKKAAGARKSSSVASAETDADHSNSNGVGPSNSQTAQTHDDRAVVATLPPGFHTGTADESPVGGLGGNAEHPS